MNGVSLTEEEMAQGPTARFAEAQVTATPVLYHFRLLCKIVLCRARDESALHGTWWTRTMLKSPSVGKGSASGCRRLTSGGAQIQSRCQLPLLRPSAPAAQTYEINHPYRINNYANRVSKEVSRDTQVTNSSSSDNGDDLLFVDFCSGLTTNSNSPASPSPYAGPGLPPRGGPPYSMALLPQPLGEVPTDLPISSAVSYMAYQDHRAHDGRWPLHNEPAAPLAAWQLMDMDPLPMPPPPMPPPPPQLRLPTGNSSSSPWMQPVDAASQGVSHREAWLPHCIAAAQGGAGARFAEGHQGQARPWHNDSLHQEAMRLLDGLY